MHVVLWPLRLRLPQVCAKDFHSSPHDSPFSWDLSSDSPMVHVLPRYHLSSFSLFFVMIFLFILSLILSVSWPLCSALDAGSHSLLIGEKQQSIGY